MFAQSNGHLLSICLCNPVLCNCLGDEYIILLVYHAGHSVIGQITLIVNPLHAGAGGGGGARWGYDSQDPNRLGSSMTRGEAEGDLAPRTCLAMYADSPGALPPPVECGEHSHPAHGQEKQAHCLELRQ